MGPLEHSLTRPGGGEQRRDVLAALLLGGAVFAYLATLPRVLVGVDEAHYLHYAVRLLAGERIYRDFFDLTTPGWVWLVALSFRLFGATLGNARVLAALIQAGIAVSTYVACRQVGARRPASVALGASVAVIAHGYYFAASQHWLATLLCMLLLVVCLRDKSDLATCFLCGVLNGALGAVHQGRAAAIAVGTVAFFSLRRRPIGAASTEGPALWLQVAMIAGGGAAVLVPVLLYLLSTSGLASVWEALVVGPLVNYRAMGSVPWGTAFAVARPSWERLMRFLPLTLLPMVVLAVVRVWRGPRDRRARAALALISLGVAGLWSIRYYPDLIHIALVSPPCVVAVGAAWAWGSEMLPRSLRTRLAAFLGVALCAGLAFSLARLDAGIRAKAGFRYASRFGEVYLTGPNAARQLDMLRALVDATPGRILYHHPVAGYTYLLMGATNPTRFDFVTPPQTSDAQQREIIDRLAAGGVPYVVMAKSPPSPRDQVAEFIRQHYTQLNPDSVSLRSVWLRR